MKKGFSTHFFVALIVLIGGAGVLAGEYYLVKWLPKHGEREREEALRLLPYQNAALGVEMQVAAGLYGRVEDFPGGVRIARPKFWSIGPSLTLTSQPNPDGTFEFSPQIAAKWQTAGAYEGIPRYRFQRTKINNRDAVLIWRYENRAMLLTARIITSERLIEMDCTPGRADEQLFMQACDASVRTTKVAGPEPPPPPEPVLELTPPRRRR